MAIRSFPFFKQPNEKECGLTCLRIIAKYHGKQFSSDAIRVQTGINVRQGGSNLEELSQAAEKIELRSLAVRIAFDKLIKLPLPCVAHWQQQHYVVVHKIKGGLVYVADPAHGLLKYTFTEFKQGWASMAQENGVVLLLEPTSKFYQQEILDDAKISYRFFLPYIFRYKRYFYQLLLGTLIGNVLQLIAPFLTQSVVDNGIVNQDIGFINTMLVAQLMLTISTTAYTFISSWISLHVGARISLAIIADFIAKIMRLPLSFFDYKTTGDILQRLNDHGRITRFLAASTVGTLFSLLNLFVYGAYMALYSVPILVVFVVGTLLHAGWVLLFLKIRRDFDYKSFHLAAQNENAMIELVTGIHEIKLNHIEIAKRWEWERIQAKIYQLSIRKLKISQYQEGGALLIGQLKNIFITYLTVSSVIEAKLSLGMMLSIQFILGQLNAPFAQLIGLIQGAQDAKIGLERLGEVHNEDDEDAHVKNAITILPERQDILLRNVSFHYESNLAHKVLKEINLQLEPGKVTAIVGRSGSGKTTLLKLLLKYYSPTSGEIRVGGSNLTNLASGEWRSRCGVVMQDGFIFSDTIAKNIALGDAPINREQLLAAVRIANLQQFIESLPLAYNTRLGKEGMNLSQGQKQRLLIARSVYKNPDYFFFDEATNALDATNERIIMSNLAEFTLQKTVVIVAHRLSTVMNADQIIVMEQGEIREKGNHLALTREQGIYFELVKNQLALGH